MRKLLATSVLIILLTSVVSYVVYIAILQKLSTAVNQDHNMLLWAFIVNTVLAIVIVLAMILLRKRFKDQLAYIFMAGSFLKFACFFIFFYPTFHADGNLSRSEFFSFFIPYAICLVTETITAIKFLNRVDAEN